jgi:hypothetical protein
MIKRPESSGTHFYKVEGITHNTEEERRKAAANLARMVQDEELRELVRVQLDLPELPEGSGA